MLHPHTKQNEITRAVILGSPSSEKHEAKALRDYCKQHGFTVDKVFTVSAPTAEGKREGLLQVLRYITQQLEPVALVVYSSERLARGFEAYSDIFPLIRSGQLEFHTYRDRKILNQDMDLPEELSLNMTNLMNASYIAQIRQHVKQERKLMLKNKERVEAL